MLFRVSAPVESNILSARHLEATWMSIACEERAWLSSLLVSPEKLEIDLSIKGFEDLMLG